MILQDWLVCIISNGWWVLIKDIEKLYQICGQFLGKKIATWKINYKHRIEKNIFYEYTYLVTIYKYILKKPVH